MVKSAALYHPVQDDLRLVDEMLDTLKQDVDFPPLVAMMDMVITGSGKRLRPALALLAGTFGEYRLDLLVPLAASVELLHTATLVHDDVIDGATTRRGHTTVNAMFHNSTTVMLGDYMFANAADLVARTGNIRVIRLFSHTLLVMAKGEIGQDMSAYDSRQGVQDYLHRIAGKTASLFATACEGGAIIGGEPEEHIQALRDYGYNLGMAFQIVDDILDFTGDETEMGKPVGSDLWQGTLTLPSLILMDRYPQDNPVTKLFGNRRRREHLDQAVTMVRESDIPGESFAMARSFCDKAREAISILPERPALETLLNLTDYILERSS
ncbi:MAG TPA: polyprenyl synthetase family protein [Dehalococcoidia bacterium]|nr:polyprenyl synthetase family protein [Dehalococcoidia bacterium]